LAATAIGHGLRGFELNWLVQENDERIDCYLDELTNIIFYGLISESSREPVKRPPGRKAIRKK
jgi:hypothetical protein